MTSPDSEGNNLRINIGLVTEGSVGTLPHLCQGALAVEHDSQEKCSGIDMDSAIC